MDSTVNPLNGSEPVDTRNTNTNVNDTKMSVNNDTGQGIRLPMKNNVTRKRPISMISGSTIAPKVALKPLASAGNPSEPPQQSVDYSGHNKIAIKRDPYGDFAAFKPANTFSDFHSNESMSSSSRKVDALEQPNKKGTGNRKRRNSASKSHIAPKTPRAQKAPSVPLSPPGNSEESPAVYRARPVRSCTHCRQQKIKCNALETFPAPCTRCAKMDRKCVVDPFFKPQKGGQVQSLRDDISSLKQQLAQLQRKSSNGSPDSGMSVSPNLEPSSPLFYAQSPESHRLPSIYSGSQARLENDPKARHSTDHDSPSLSPGSSINCAPQHATDVDMLPQNQNYPIIDIDSNSRVLSGDSLPNKQHNPKSHLHKISVGAQRHPSVLSAKGHLLISDSSSPGSPLSTHHQAGSVPISTIISQDMPTDVSRLSPPMIDTNRPGDKVPEDHIHSSRQTSASLSSADHSDYIMGDVRLPYDKAEELHSRFMTQYLPFLPIIQSNSAAELYRQSQLLFWTVCLTASLSEPVPTLYNSLSMLIKQLAIETCWIQTPRSTHIVQALLILGNWPLPNEKVLDDCSYRFVTLAKALAMQLGLHRGKFIYEFSRTQVSLPDAEKWRTRTWISIFIAEQVWCANLGLPPNMPMDYLLEESRTDTSLPKAFRSLACLAMFCSKLVNLLGSSVTSPDGTLEPKNRFSTLGILEQELDRLIAEMGNEDGKTLVSIMRFINCLTLIFFFFF